MEVGLRCQYKAPVGFSSRKYIWYLFLAGPVSTRRSYCGRQGYVNEKFQWHLRESNPLPSVLYCSASTNFASAYWRNNINYFSVQIYLISVAKLQQFCILTLIIMIATVRRCSTCKLHVCTYCLQQIAVQEVIRPFVLLLRHGYCLVKNIKSIS